MWVLFWIKEMMCRIILMASRVAVPHGVFVFLLIYSIVPSLNF